MTFAIKYSQPNIVEMVNDKKDVIVANLVYQMREQVKVGTPIFVLTGGDGNTIKNRPEPGVWAIGLVSSMPVDDPQDGKTQDYYKFEIEIRKWFDKSITRSDLMYYPQTFDVSPIGPTSKGEKNQALSILNDDQLYSILAAMVDMGVLTLEEVELFFGEDVRNQVATFDVEVLELKKRVPRQFMTGPGANLLVYGAPGTGKSHFVENEYRKNFDGYFERVTFFEDYDYSDFVGGLRPSRNLEGQINYNFSEGAFTRVLIEALNHPDQSHLLIIEELNRAEASNVFGDVFQLLDRDDQGRSEFAIYNTDLSEFLSSHVNYDYDFTSSGIKIPGNMTIVATMNPSDQGVHQIDTAFRRRWDSKYMPIEFAKDDAIADTDVAIFNVPWKLVVRVFNQILSQPIMGVEEDGLIGPHFMKSSELQNPDKVAAKFLGYLWNDVVRYNRDKIFLTSNFANVVKEFKEGHLEKVFESSVLEALQTVEGE